MVKQCFCCHGLYDVDDVIASPRRSSLNALTEDLDVEESDISTIRDFYDLYKKSYDTPLCWDCALFRGLKYTEKYDDKRNGLFLVLLSLDMMYSQIVFHCIDDEMMDIDGETMFRSLADG
jgi:hypothetical protein